MITGIKRTLLQVFAVSLGSALVALSANHVREDRLPLRMPFPPEYSCPSLVTAGEPIGVAMALETFGRPDIGWVDARKEKYFKIGHIKGAVNIPYSFLEPISDTALVSLRSFETVIVYCNTVDSERSKLMAGELSLAGVEGVTYLEGGFLAWVEHGGAYEGERPQAYEELME